MKKKFQTILFLCNSTFKGPSLQENPFVPQLSSWTMQTSLKNRDPINSFSYKLSLKEVMHACWDEIQDNWGFQ